MSFGIKVAKKGYSVLDKTKSKSTKLSKSTPCHIHYGLALPYLNGAYLQIERFNNVISEPKDNAPNIVIKCLHEISALFEDLSTVAIYVKMAGQENKFHKLIIDIRNHIRHDIRENFEQEDEVRRIGRVKRLNIDPTLLTDIGFEKEKIKIGEVSIKVLEIKTYLDWAKEIIQDSLNDAKNKGFIKFEK